MNFGSDFDHKGSLDRDFATKDLEQNGIKIKLIFC